jgi:hypothetical protein
VLQSIDADEVDRMVGAWLAKQKGVRVQGVALDGKTLRGSGDGEKPPVHLLSAITHDSGVVLAQESVGEKTNEIKHAASVLQDVDLAGRTVTADAMHTQRDFARFLVEEKQADYILIAKENQPTVLDDLKTQHDGCARATVRGSWRRCATSRSGGCHKHRQEHPLVVPTRTCVPPSDRTLLRLRPDRIDVVGPGY